MILKYQDLIVIIFWEILCLNLFQFKTLIHILTSHDKKLIISSHKDILIKSFQNKILPLIILTWNFSSIIKITKKNFSNFSWIWRQLFRDPNNHYDFDSKFEKIIVYHWKLKNVLGLNLWYFYKFFALFSYFSKVLKIN